MSEKTSTVFFNFSVGESKEDVRKRLQETKQIGFSNIIASYKTSGMQQVKFDEDYFAALDVLVAACQKEQVKFWLEDYAPFPTGSANGAYKEEEYVDLNKLYIDERHVDLVGPLEAVVRIDSLQSSVYGKAMNRFVKTDPSGRKRVCVLACRMLENPASAAAPFLEEDSAVILDAFVENGFLKWDVPEGVWRIFVIYTTREASGRADFMNLLSRDSVALEIEKVHVPLYEHLKEELGKTWIGFFYDEPEVGNAGGDAVFDFFMLPGRRSQNVTDCNVFSWSPEMPKEMEKRDADWLRRLPCLWYDGTKDVYRDFRCQYMDAVSALVRENYNGQVYAFCRTRGIRYIGHVLEDENCHARLGCGPSHYFRQQYFQDEAGIDVIAGQIMPGKDRATTWYGVINSDGEFYHYGLAKLASSEAHINPLKQNRSAVECFAMYGQQGLAERKFLVDHLMVNGVNRMFFAELPSYQASVEYSRSIVDYTDRMCALLRSARPMIQTAILYHAESEWREGEKAQKFQKAGARLAREQISYDVVPADVFAFPDRYETETAQGLTVNGNPYGAFIVPACERLTEAVAEFVRGCAKTGFPVFFTDRIPEGFAQITKDCANIRCIPLTGLAEAVRAVLPKAIAVEADKKEWIRCLHVRKDQTDYYLLHNEALCGGTDCRITLPAGGRALVWDAMEDRMLKLEQERTADEALAVSLHLGQYEMAVLCVSAGACADKGAGTDGDANGDADANMASAYENERVEIVVIQRACVHKGDWELEFADGCTIKGMLGCLPRPEEHTGYDFYGKLVYRTKLDAQGQLPRFLELGTVSDCCEVFVNGVSAGKRAASPYRFEVEGLMRQGVNEITAEVYTSAANSKNPVSIFGVPMDALTAIPYTTVEAMGITGPVNWLY